MGTTPVDEWHKSVSDIVKGISGSDDKTRSRTIEFLERNAKWVLDTFVDCVVNPPEILSGPDGSIDLHWDYPEYEMLINIPTNPISEIGFYYDNNDGLQIKGTLTQMSRENVLIRRCRDREPCDHRGCASHVTHLCEGCEHLGEGNDE